MKLYNHVDAIYTDFSKVFDKIAHNMLEKLAGVAACGDLLRRFNSYNQWQPECIAQIFHQVSPRVLIWVHSDLICILTISPPVSSTQIS